MVKMLNCSNLEDSYNSIAEIVGVDTVAISDFVERNQYRFAINEWGSLEYDEKLTIEDILIAFNITSEQISFEYVVVQQVAAVLDEGSYFTNGLMNLQGLFTTDNAFRSKLYEHGLSIGERANGELFIELEGKSVNTVYLKGRMEIDMCINGFLTGYDAETDRNVERIKKCPEIVTHIGGYLLNSTQLEEEWTVQAKPSVVSFKVKLNEIQELSFVQFTMQHLLIASIEHLLMLHASYDQIFKPMVFLKENISIEGSRIIGIRSI